MTTKRKQPKPMQRPKLKIYGGITGSTEIADYIRDTEKYMDYLEWQLECERNALPLLKAQTSQ